MPNSVGLKYFTIVLADEKQKEQVCESLKILARLLYVQRWNITSRGSIWTLYPFQNKRRSLIKASLFLIMAFHFGQIVHQIASQAQNRVSLNLFAFQDDKVIMTALYWIRINGW